MDSSRYDFPSQIGKMSNLRKIGRAGLSQSNARKYNRQCKLANQRKVPVITRQKKFRCLTAVRWLTLLASCCCECRLVLLLFCFGFLSGPFKRKMYDQTDECSVSETINAQILENVQLLKLWTRIRKHCYLSLDDGITKTN